MNTADKRARILNAQLKEEAVSIAEWGDALIIRELSGKAGTELIKMCSDDKGNVDQNSLVAGIILATLRDAEDSAKSLIFGQADKDEPDPVYRDQLMATGLQNIMSAAKQSIKLSGLDESAQVEAAKNASGETSVANSPTISQAA